MEPILVLADIHLGRKQSGDKKVGPGLEWALRMLIDASRTAHHLIILGDVIDRKRFTQATYEEVDTLLRRGLELFQSVVFIPGNHDVHHALDLPRGVTVAGVEPATYRAGGWALHTAAVEVDKDPRELVARFPLPVDGAPNIGLLHTSVTGEWSNNPCLPCTVDELRGCGYDAWLLGHVHQRVTLAEDPFIGWVGMGRGYLVSHNPDGVHVEDFGEHFPRGGKG